MEQRFSPEAPITRDGMLPFFSGLTGLLSDQTREAVWDTNGGLSSLLLMPVANKS
ncbi:hypothetical protein Sinac_7203 [Singulisphaera acidiphila DSM 18658]|uniref:Uncharacterized protein n=1 Tax=Singulisphaera acidiphila (strain ATCC BAA-1392 / DSM 18658 / VKM B-2454 / MOB10) TaxID=886293 RepID=L0DS75_SINAD|nr:hypothetical protein Sinac_7203 [Singulisphaera acidiphila DSM 18658]